MLTGRLVGGAVEVACADEIFVLCPEEAIFLVERHALSVIDGEAGRMLDVDGCWGCFCR